MIDLIGWVATGIFVGSYFCRSPIGLRRLQMLGALIWAAYGFLLHAPPVITANILLIAAAAWTGKRRAEGLAP